jgi:CRP/FNR family transcriptional regulator
MSQLTTADLERNFPFLLEPANQAAKEQVLQHVPVRQFPTGDFICWEGDVCTHLPVVLAGVVRVYKVGENGREITLYRIEENDSCILTASCILSQIRFPALAVVERDVRAALIAAPILRQWMKQYDIWQAYVFKLMSRRLADVITTVEEIAFRRVGIRIAEFLAKLAEGQEHIPITHQEIAYELGSAREVGSHRDNPLIYCGDRLVSALCVIWFINLFNQKLISLQGEGIRLLLPGERWGERKI